MAAPLSLTLYQYSTTTLCSTTRSAAIGYQKSCDLLQALSLAKGIVRIALIGQLLDNRSVDMA